MWQMAHILDGDDQRTRSGWSCPSCGRGFAPKVTECPYCPVKPPEPVVFTADGLVPVSEAFRMKPREADGGEREEAIFVPTRDGVTPSQVADAQHLLRYTARHIVKGEFVVLPPGAKILPAHPGRGWMRLPDEMADPGYNRLARATGEWADVVPGFQCRLSAPGEQIVYFRLAPADAR